jgi:hypothetical protein
MKNSRKMPKCFAIKEDILNLFYFSNDGLKYNFISEVWF